MKLFLCAGEPSGDARAAELMKALSERIPDIEYTGVGGKKMAALATGPFIDWADEAVVGLWDVIKKYGWFRKQFRERLEQIEAEKPDAVLFIDYPGFNLRIAKALWKQGSTSKRFYYISPQVWAWNRKRISEMAQTIHLMLCIFPFEEPLYRASGLKTIFPGHPMVDSLTATKLEGPREENLLALLPGSRRREIHKNFPVMLEAARLLRERLPDLRLHSTGATPALLEMMREEIARAGLPSDFCQLTIGDSHTLMQRATAGMVASGTATMEAAFYGLPFAIVYRVSWITWVVGKRVVRVPFLGMPNILANREIVREFLQENAQPKAIADHVYTLLTEPTARAALQADLATAAAQLGSPGAAGRAADAIAAALRE